MTFRYIDDVLSLNNPKSGDYIDVIYPQELQIQDTTDAGNWANYLDLRLEFDTNKDVQLRSLKLHSGNYMAVILTLLVNITFLFHTCYRVCLIIISDLGSNLNCDGCHMWGRRC